VIGKVKSISKFGLFVLFSDAKTGLLRWSNLPKKHGKFKSGDLIGIEVLKVHEVGKYELKFVERDFKETFGHFLEESAEQLEQLKIKNGDLRRL
jgi:predicted RNA-binding protein with RPS1 domain